MNPYPLRHIALPQGRWGKNCPIPRIEGAKVRTKSKTNEPVLDDRGPTADRLAKAEHERGDTGIVTIQQHPIARLVSGKTLTKLQGRAAEKFYAHWYRAGMAGTIGSADLLRIFGTTNDFTGLSASEAAVRHRQLLEEARAEVRKWQDKAGLRGDDGVRLLDLVVCQEMGLAEAGQKIGFRIDDRDEENGFKHKEAQVMARTLLRSALNILIDHWEL